MLRSTATAHTPAVTAQLNIEIECRGALPLVKPYIS